MWPILSASKLFALDLMRSFLAQFCPLLLFAMNPGADPGGLGPPPLTIGFEAPKLSIFGPYLIFS